MIQELKEAEVRNFEAMIRDFGNIATDYLLDDDVKEVLVCSNKKMFIDTNSKGFIQVGEIDPDRTARIIKNMAHYAGQSLDNQRITVEIPIYKCMNGERFSGQLPPLAPSPSFTLRKKPKSVFDLEDYVNTGRMTEIQKDCLIESVEPGTLDDGNEALKIVWAKELENKLINNLSKESRSSMTPKNILFCGGPGSGKTTVMNSTLKKSTEINPDQRYVVIEKLMSEIQCRGNHVQQFISNSIVSMQECVEIAMVSRPDRIIVGEIKGAEALDMIKAWNTGTPGGMGTVHANSPLECFQRVADLCMEAGLKSAPWNQIMMTVDVVVWVGRRGSESGFIKQVLFTKGSEHEETRFLEKIKFSAV